MIIQEIRVEYGVPYPQETEWDRLAEAMAVGDSALVPFHEEDNLFSSLRRLGRGYISEQDKDGGVRVWVTY